MDLQGLFHCSLHIILLWGLKGTAQVTDINNLTCPILCARLLLVVVAWLLLLCLLCPPQSTVHPSHNALPSQQSFPLQHSPYLAEKNINRESAPRNVENRNVPKEGCKLICIHSG